MRTLTIMLIVSLGIGCSTHSADTKPKAQVTEAAPADSRDEVRGIAENAKGGAVILTEAGAVVYIVGLNAWPDETRGKQVVARGKLEEANYLPDPVVADDGAISAGAAGLETVLRDADWSVVD